MYKRIVLKLSGEAVGNNKEIAFDDGVILEIVRQVKKVISTGTQVAIVIGGGNIWRGRSANPRMDRVKAGSGMRTGVRICWVKKNDCTCRTVSPSKTGSKRSSPGSSQRASQRLRST